MLTKLVKRLFSAPAVIEEAASTTELALNDAAEQREASLSEAEIQEMVEILNARIVDRYAGKGLILPEGFRPIERFEEGEKTTIYYADVTDDGQWGGDEVVMLSEPCIVSNLPLIVFDDLGEGMDLYQFEACEALKTFMKLNEDNDQDNPILLPLNMLEGGITLKSGKKLGFFSDWDDCNANISAELETGLEEIEEFLERKYDFYLYAELDKDFNGRTYMKLCYNLEEDMPSPAQIKNIGEKVLEKMKDHQDLHAVVVLPEDSFINIDELANIGSKHTYVFENPNYKRDVSIAPPPLKIENPDIGQP